MGNSKRRHMFRILDSILILSLAVFILLDTFVITRGYAEIVTDTDSNSVVSSETYTGSEDSENAGVSLSDSSKVSENTYTAEETKQSDPVITGTGYEDENISIEISEYRYCDTTIYVADVQVSSAEYLSTAFANSTYGKNVTDSTSNIADSVNAILAINGDFYGGRNYGYVLRNGVLYRETSKNSSQEDLVIWSDGSFGIFTEGEADAEELLNSGAVQIFSFGPALITDGEISVSENDEVGKAMASNPRTAICEVSPLHYLFVVSDGRTDESEGLSLHELAEFIQSLGVDTAYNLDGGGSSTMVFNGQVLNKPTTGGTKIKERSVSDIVYIGYQQ